MIVQVTGVDVARACRQLKIHVPNDALDAVATLVNHFAGDGEERAISDHTACVPEWETDRHAQIIELQPVKTEAVMTWLSMGNDPELRNEQEPDQ
ncbi:hypothetical protein [Burkholderia ambifaria]|uniref:hypothetical protein n=1 Tax=Burkholderia ambifaria TaxID=152480 RepID=UPI0005B784ED|nr:hypothetical protein [Burkholderia ambifaria]